jgi:hypothetical protein
MAWHLTQLPYWDGKATKLAQIAMHQASSSAFSHNQDPNRSWAGSQSRAAAGPHRALMCYLISKDFEGRPGPAPSAVDHYAGARLKGM